MSRRDNFSEHTKRALAFRAGWMCSFDGCKKLTVGPSDEGPEAIAKLGEAAHICAASPGGRRFDGDMTSDERSNIHNAIWLCTHHATLIDRDSVTYTVDDLYRMKISHEEFCAQQIRLGATALVESGLFAIGSKIVCTGTLSKVEANSWTIELGHFLIGERHDLYTFIDEFAHNSSVQKYVLSNELGDGRLLSAAPVLYSGTDGYRLICQVSERSARKKVQNLGSSFATNEQTNDIFLNAQGNIDRVSGLDYFPQRVREVLSMQQGENWFSPNSGMRFFEYFSEYSGSPWLDLLFKLDLVRQISIPRSDSALNQQYAPLPCVNRVRQIELLATAPTENRLPVKIDLDVEGLGRWTQNISIYMPTLEQMEERKKLIESSPFRNIPR